MKRRIEWVPVGGLLATVMFAAYAVVQLNAQGPTPPGDYTKASTAQVRTAEGEVVLQGTFGAPVEEDGDLERRAALAPAGRDADASGEAEIEFASAGATVQEVEFSVRNVDPDTRVTLMIDGVDVATATTDRRGRAEVEIDVALPAATSSR
jgi:hypothetical protein